ncbi:alpha/beta hydrolase [Spiribacter halobius]|uniref:Alpha/beta hydrolase n=1 Tax=Sediminicurvatus halobius TaxID=2182432 RepID=A0A2U2MW33_9GAMM|nr:alpha/beta hydrolase [Spiribacter halobius]PWG61054.1 alpha/beta hydrolase [Spiribacter halobius]UEX76774.1 alpha/beta hydrolase [Spiribacter halobius]
MDWRALDAETLEVEYNPRRQVADAEALLATVAERSAAARGRLGEPHEFAYGPEPLARVDVYPAAGHARPLHVFFHGGYWRGQDKRDYAYLAEALLARGVSVALANYPLCPQSNLPAIHEAACRCLQLLADSAHGLGADPARLTLGGHSAGGQIVARLLAEGPVAPAGAVAASGVFDLLPVVHTSINEALRLDEAGAEAVSPLRRPPPRWRGPLLLAVGGAESAAFQAQTADYAAHCRGAGPAIDAVTVPGRHHFDILDALYGEQGELFSRLAALVETT